MEKRLEPHGTYSTTDTHPFVLGDLYASTHTNWIILLTGLEPMSNGWGWSVEFVRLHDWRTFIAIFSASEWRSLWERITH